MDAEMRWTWHECMLASNPLSSQEMLDRMLCHISADSIPLPRVALCVNSKPNQDASMAPSVRPTRVFRALTNSLPLLMEGGHPTA